MQNIGPAREQIPSMAPPEWIRGTVLLSSAQHEIEDEVIARSEVHRLELLFVNDRPLAQAEMLGELDDLVDWPPSCDGGAEGCACGDIDDLWDAS